MTAFIVHDVILVNRIGYHYERLISYRNLVTTDVIDVINEPEVLEDLERGLCKGQPYI
jgi:hypothetical protein